MSLSSSTELSKDEEINTTISENSAVKNESVQAYSLYVNNDGNLSIMMTDLDVDRETQLRSFITKKITSGSVLGWGGNITNVDFSLTEDSSKPAGCFYYQITGSGSQQFVVCLLSTPDLSLDLFEEDLLHFSSTLTPGLQGDFDVPQMTKILSPLLSEWKSKALSYLASCVKLLQKDCAVLLYVGLTGCDLTVEGGSEEICRNIKRFSKRCSVTHVLTIPQPSCPLPSLKLTISDDSSTYLLNFTEVNKYCQSWARLLVEGGQDNPVFIKRTLDNFKLKVIQNMNLLKRLISEAENDYYYLYRSRKFLKESGCAAELLSHIKAQDCSANNKQTQSVIQTLDFFVSETKPEYQQRNVQ